MDFSSPFAPSLQTDALLQALNAHWRTTLAEFTAALAQAEQGLLPAAWRANPLEAHDTAAKLGLDPKRMGDQAYILLNRALRQAVWELSVDALDLLPWLDDDGLERDLNKVLNKQPLMSEIGQLFLDAATFDRPQNCGFFLAVQRLYTAWLRTMGMENWEAEAVSRRLPCSFFRALQEEAQAHAVFYSTLLREVGISPFFGGAAMGGGRWGRYMARMLQNIDNRMGDEPFGLREVYVPPMAYSEPSDESLAFAGNAPRKVVDLGKEILRWVYVPERGDAVRFIAGEGGSGKSSFLIALAAELAGSSLFPNEQKTRPGFPILFIPFAELEYQGNLMDALRHYAAKNSLPESTLINNSESGERLLVIIDDVETIPLLRGSRRRMLDDFYNQLSDWLQQANAESPKLQILLSGSRAAWQEVPEALMRLKAMLWLLPFYTTPEAREGYRDETGLLNNDLRDAWWRGYQSARGIKQEGLPKKVRSEPGRDFLSRPLDCRIAATAWAEKGDAVFDRQEGARDQIFEALLERNYRRLVPEAKGTPPVAFAEYHRLVAECAVLAWHADDADGHGGRGISLAGLHAHAAQNRYLQGLMQKLMDVAGAELDQFFRAPFFKSVGGSKGVGNSWKLNPEDLGDWLVAGRLAGSADRLCQLRTDAAGDLEETRYEQRALALWGGLAAVAPVQAGQGSFLVRALQRLGNAKAQGIQATFADLCGYVLRHGMHLEAWHTLPTVKEVIRRSRHAEESILMVLDAAAQVTGEISKVAWPHVDAPRTWLHRMQGGVDSRGVPHGMKCLNRLDLTRAQMMGCDLIGASLEYSDLTRATLRGSNLAEANLTGAVLYATDLCVADLAAATLIAADLREADLRGAILRAADLRNANLAGADLKGAALDYANLSGADLSGADLATANLHGAELEGAILTGTILDEAFVALAES